MILERNHDKYSIEEVRYKILKKHPHIQVISNDYVSNKTPLKLKCSLDGFEWNANLNNLMSGWGCKRCSGKEKYTLDSFKSKLENTSPNLKVISTEFVNTHSKIKVKCDNDGFEWMVKPYKLLQFRGCPKCRLKNEKRVGDRISLFLGYTPAKLTINADIYDSKGNKIRSKVEVDYHFTYKNSVYFVEYNGSQHYRPVNFGQGKERAELQYQKQKIRDDWLSKYCLANGINLVIINGDEVVDDGIDNFIDLLFKDLK